MNQTGEKKVDMTTDFGRNVKARRKELGLTMQEFADAIQISRQAVSRWESQTNPSLPDQGLLPRIEEVLHTSVDALIGSSDRPLWIVRERIFSEEHMYTKLRTYAMCEKLDLFFSALSYAREKHEAQTRKPGKYTAGDAKGIPYIIHPLMMACHAHALGIRDDEALASIMLHDVCEDCGVRPEELPFPESVQKIVALLTKDPDHKHDEGYDADYYGAIMQNPKAAIVKAFDRCNNVATMAGSFSQEKLSEYITETEEYGYPLFDYIKEHYPQYNDTIFVIKYQVMSLIETVKALQIDGGFALAGRDDRRTE